MRLSIYDRWGEKIFESADQAEGWMEITSARHEQGVYIYTLTVVFSDGDKLTPEREYTLLR